MSIALLITDRNLTALKQGLQQQLPGVDIQCWPDIHRPEDVEFAVLWRQPPGMLAQLSNVKAVSSLGAGCDGILADSALPAQVPVVRIVDADLAEQMAEYVLATVLMLKRNLLDYKLQQQQQMWQPISKASVHRITLLGVGAIGDVVAQRLLNNGFTVTGWARSEKNDRAYPVLAGAALLVKAVANADVVVNLLPATPATKKLLNAKLFAAMPEHCYVVNVGRGDSLDEAALLQALQLQRLQGAVLDVLNAEPPAPEHPFWAMPNVLLTPHIAAITNQNNIIQQLAENYLRLKSSKPLLNLVDRHLGY